MKTIWKVLLVALALFCPNVRAQQELAGATASINSEGHLIVTSGSGRPLCFGLLALSETYGWAVDYEDPTYSGKEVVDKTDQHWLKEHPGGGHFYSPATTGFSLDLGKPAGGRPEELESITKLVELYNRTSNPDYFEVHRSPLGRIAVTGRSRSQMSSAFIPVLSTLMHPSPVRQGSTLALDDLISQCSTAANVSIQRGMIPLENATTGLLAGHNGPITCREQLSRFVPLFRYPSRYLLLYDVNTRAYYLNITIANHLVPGPDGKPISVPLNQW